MGNLGRKLASKGARQLIHMATCRHGGSRTPAVLLESVLNLPADLLEVAVGLVGLAFTFHLLVISRVAEFSLAAPLASSFL